MPVSTSPSARVDTGDSTALVQLGQGRLGLLWSDGASRRLFWATGLAAAGRAAPQVSALPVPGVNTGWSLSRASPPTVSGHVYLVARGARRATADGPARPVRELLSRDDQNHWKSSRLAVSAVRDRHRARDGHRHAHAVPVRRERLLSPRRDLLPHDQHGRPGPGRGLRAGPTGVDRRDRPDRRPGPADRRDPGAARMLRDDVLGPPAPAPTTSSKASSAAPGRAAAQSGSSFGLRDVLVWLAVLSTLALVVMLLRAETAAAGSSTVRRAGEPAGEPVPLRRAGPGCPSGCWPAPCCCPGCGDC